VAKPAILKGRGVLGKIEKWKIQKHKKQQDIGGGSCT
jgi:hypothetical protein